MSQPTDKPNEWYAFMLANGGRVRVDWFGRTPTVEDVRALRAYLGLTERAMTVDIPNTEGEHAETRANTDQ